MRLYVLALLCLPTLSLPAQAQWDLQDSHTTASLRGIHNVGGGVAWASGTNGTVLRTEDGGYLWQTCTTPPGAEQLDFRGIQAFDESTAIVMSSGKGDLSRLYRTTDGCKTWKLVFTNPDKDGFWDAMRFDERKPDLMSPDYYRNHMRGVLIGDPVNGNFVIYETSNSGNTWWRWPNDKSAKPAKALPKEAIFAASNSSLMLPGFNEAFAFVTGGATGSRLIMAKHYDLLDNGGWSSFATMRIPFSDSESSGGFSIAARYPSSGELEPDVMVVGGDYKHSDVIGANAFFVPFTHFGAFRHARAPETPPHGYRSSVAYDATTKTWITVGPNGTDISRDDGKNWTALKPGPEDSPDADKNWNALSLPFVVGPKGRIGKLRDDALQP